MKRSMTTMVVVLTCCCSSPQEPNGTSSDDNSSPPTPEVNGRSPTPAPQPTPESMGECLGELWAPAYPAVDHDFPPDGYVGCGSDDECGEQVVLDCCGSYAVAVNLRFRHCLSTRGPGAACRARCAVADPTEINRSRTPACIDGACRLVPEDGGPARLVRLPFDPNQ